jgi:membrane protein implicated in regulation of membrane protease activity
MTRADKVKEPVLERQGRRLGHSGGWFLLLAALIAIPGVILVVLGGSAVSAVGIGVLILAGAPAIVGIGLLLSSAVARWSARHKLFA